MALPASDDFNRANANPIGGNWTTQGDAGAMKIVSAEIYGVGAEWNAAYWNADSFNADQYSECSIPTVIHAGPSIRNNTASGTKNFYFLDVRPADIKVKKWVNNTETEIYTAARSNADGHTWKISATGTTISFYDNGALIDTVVDTSLTSGAAGIATYSSTIAYDNWAGGNVGAATTPITVNTLTDSLAGGEIL